MKSLAELLGESDALITENARLLKAIRKLLKGSKGNGEHD